MQRINRAEFPRSLPSAKHFGHAAKEWAKILLHDALQVDRSAPPRAHHLALHNSRIQWMTRDVVEVRACVGHDLFARRQITGQYFADARDQSPKHLIENRAVQRLFVFEVVIE